LINQFKKQGDEYFLGDIIEMSFGGVQTKAMNLL